MNPTHPPPPLVLCDAALIPLAQLDTFGENITDAMVLAGTGHAAYGRQIFLEGRAYARDASRAGEDWGEELEGVYSQALDRYDQRCELDGDE